MSAKWKISSSFGGQHAHMQLNVAASSVENTKTLSITQGEFSTFRFCTISHSYSKNVIF